MLPFLSQTAALFTHAGFAIAGAAAVSIPILIHLLTRIKRRPIQWGAMKFLLEAYRKHRKRLQLEQWLLLLVRCLVLLILGFALAGPLLGGCAQKLGIDSTGRVICLIIDDGLSEQALNEKDTPRFERQKKVALRMIDGLGSADHVAVFRTARPADALITPPTIDRASARRAVEDLKPRNAKSDLIGAIKEARTALAEKSIAADRAFIVLLSDFSQGSLAVDQAMPADSAKLDQLARVLVARPLPSASNVQISKFAPRRRMILTGGYASEGPARIPVEIELRRFADDSPSRISKVQLSLITDDPSKPLAIFPSEEIRWPAFSPGEESKVTLQRDLILPAEALDALNLGPTASSTGRIAAATVVLRAAIEPDALNEDNERFAVVELRQRLRVAVAGDATGASPRNDNEISPDTWMSIALAPALDLGALEVSEIPAFDLDEKKIAAADAVIILRPDQLSDTGWKALRDLVNRGGMVWIFPPASDVPATWGDALRTRLGVPWQLGIDPQNLIKPDTAPGTAASQGLSLVLDKPTPQLMQRLSADWKELLRPIHVKKRLALTLPPAAGSDTIWLTTDDNQPLLVSASVGDGAVFLLTTALDLTWTNLPAKPLFVPLLHETLANVQARSAEAARLSNITSGEQPALTRIWEDAAQLQRLSTTGAAESPLMLRRTDQGFVPVSPLDKPGIYRAAPQVEGRMFAVNVDASAGNTTALELPQLEAWLASLGATQWLDDNNPAAALAAFESRANIGQLLLWITLTFLILELFLARRFSHAHTGQQHTVVGVGAALYNRFVGKPKT